MTKNKVEVEFDNEDNDIVQVREVEPKGAVGVTSFGEGVFPVNEYDAVVYEPKEAVTVSDVRYAGDKARLAMKNDAIFYLGGTARNMFDVFVPPFLVVDEYDNYIMLKKPGHND